MTKPEYLENLEIVLEYMPDYALIEDLKRGYSKRTARYMKSAMKKVEIPQKAVSQTPVDPDNEEFRRLQIKKGQLFTDRAKESNKFHKAKDDDERKQISKNIQSFQKDIEQVFFEEDFFRQHGKLPELKEALPEDPIEAIKKRNSFRSSISRYKKQLNALALLPEKHPDKSKIQGIESKLKSKQLELEIIEKSIETRTY